MSTLIYSQAFGFRTVDKTPSNVVPGTLMRHLMAHPDSGISGDQWFVMMRRKDRHGRNILMDWVKISKDQIPAKVKMEALLLGLQL